MTTPRYLDGCVAGSQVCGDAAPAAWSSSSAWYVNFNNGNANNNHRNNECFVRAVRSVSAPPAGEYQGEEPVTLRALHAAWTLARRQKVPSHNQVAFDTHWLDGLLELQQQLGAGTWSPRPSTCFVATRPKAREIHAPDFGDRVVHHWLVPQLEAVYEPRFIHDSYANRKGKGSHAAVRRLQAYVRQVQSGEGGGWYLQLDIANFFNRIHRETLYAMLKRRMVRAGVALPAQRAVHALLRRSPLDAGVHYRSTAAERAAIPRHKQLANAPKGCGVPIGNLSSQFFANVYLDRLDQFVKHTLKAQRYLRYVDDFVLVHRDRAQLAAWLWAIETFLRDELRLELKADIKLRPLRDGIDFLGYVVFPTHTRVRARVLTHAREALAAWQRAHVRRREIRAAPVDLDRVRCIWRSYEGHLRHADAHRLNARLLAKFPWIPAAVAPRRFHPSAQRRVVTVRFSQ